MSEPAKKKVAKPADHPKYIEMIVAAITTLKERNGSSAQAIKKYVAGNYKVSDGFATHIRQALKRGVASGDLIQTKGTGASGSFKVAKKPEPKKVPKPKPAKPTKPKTTTKKAAAKSKKPAAKSPKKKTTTKKPAKKAAAKKPVKKPVKKPAKKTPKKADKTAKKAGKKSPKKGGKKK